MVYTVSRCVEIVPEDKASVWREIFVAFVASIPFLTYGIETTSLSSSPHAGHFITSDGVPWSSTALVMAAMASAPVFSWIVDRLGRRSGIFIITLVQGASLIPLFLLNTTNTIVLHVLAGVSAGGLFIVVPAYIVEITSTSTRGFCMLIIMAMTTAGYMTRLIMTLEERMFSMTALVMLQTIMMMCICESPSFLMLSGKVEIDLASGLSPFLQREGGKLLAEWRDDVARVRSKTTLSRLKRLPEDSPSLQKQIGALKDESERAKSRGKITLITFYRNKIWWDALKVGFLLYTTMVLCGSIVFLDQEKTLVQLKVDFDPENKLVLAAMLAGSLSSLACVTFLDRKYLLTIGYITMALSSGVLAVYTQVDLTVTSLIWLPVVTLAALVLAYGISWALPIVVIAEIFTTEVRTSVLGILFSFSQLIKLVHVHTFQYLEDYVGIYTMFYIFATINLYGGVYTLFAVPSIKNKSLRQIEKQLERTPLPA